MFLFLMNCFAGRKLYNIISTPIMSMSREDGDVAAYEFSSYYYVNDGVVKCEYYCKFQLMLLYVLWLFLCNYFIKIFRSVCDSNLCEMKLMSTFWDIILIIRERKIPGCLCYMLTLLIFDTGTWTLGELTIYIHTTLHYCTSDLVFGKFEYTSLEGIMNGIRKSEESLESEESFLESNESCCDQLL